MIWELYFNCPDDKISVKAGELICKIIKYKPINEDLFSNLKLNFAETIMNNINKNVIQH